MKTDLLRLIDRMIEAHECLGQPHQLAGAVTPESPGGQLTAHLRDGTPVDRRAHAKAVFAEAAEVLAFADGIAQRPDDASPALSGPAQAIASECDALKALLLAKNKAYGNSALDPVRIFSRASPVEQIRVRIDDEISLLQRGTSFADEDTVLDLVGYLVLLRVAMKAEPGIEEATEAPATPEASAEPQGPDLDAMHGKDLDAFAATLGLKRKLVASRLPSGGKTVEGTGEFRKRVRAFVALNRAAVASPSGKGD